MLSNNLDKPSVMLKSVNLFLNTFKYKQIEYMSKRYKLYAFNLHEMNRTALVIGTMNSGKSTFLNSIIGKDIFPSKNEASTIKNTHYKCRVNTDQYTLSTNGFNQSIIYKKLSEKDVEVFNLNPRIDSIQIEGPVAPIFNLNKNITFIDTPGPINSMDKSHMKQMENALKLSFHKILYVINSTQLATDDDKLLLQRIVEHLTAHPHQKIIFIVNKVDEFENNETQSLVNLKKNVIAYLKLSGFENPDVILISALAAKLAQKAFYNQRLTRREQIELRFFEDVFTDKQFNLERYSTFKSTDEIVDYSGLNSDGYDKDMLKTIIKHSGLLNVLRAM